MCGRFALSAKTSDIEKLIPGLKKTDNDLMPRYNIAPSQDIAVILNTEPDELNFIRWGLIPFWAKEKSIGNKMINARSESITEKPSFKNSFRRRRCIIPATGFYEWQNIPGEKKKQPYFVKMKSGGGFAFAGLWDEWKDPGNGKIRSAAIITTPANELMEPIHNRMPAILPREFIQTWLSDIPNGEKELLEALNPYPSDEMEAYKISTMINIPENEGKELIEKLY